MAASETSPGRATVGAGQLHTPQEPVYDSFTQGSDAVKSTTKLAPVRTLSPPSSPEYKVLPSFASTASHQHQDELLYPDFANGGLEAPLFESQSEKSESQERAATPAPTTQLHRLQVSDSPSLAVVKGTQITIERSPDAAELYYQTCMASLESTRRLQRAAGTLPFPRRSSVQPRDPLSAQQVRLLTRPAGVTKQRSPVKRAVRPKTPTAAPAMVASPEKPAAPARRSRTPRQRTNTDFLNDAFPGDNEKKHKRAAPSKQTPSKESDLHWREMEDFAPPLSSLDASSNRLKAVWGTGTAPLDIHDELDADCLNDIEMEIAATLRLKPVQYSSNKRRIFEAKVQSLKDNKTFTKTAAQNATNIDVNKASALWTAFDKVGWFERKWFEKWL